MTTDQINQILTFYPDITIGELLELNGRKYIVNNEPIAAPVIDDRNTISIMSRANEIVEQELAKEAVMTKVKEVEKETPKPRVVRVIPQIRVPQSIFNLNKYAS